VLKTRPLKAGSPWRCAAISALFGVLLSGVAAAAPQSTIDDDRLEASYNSGKDLVRDAALDTYLKSIVDKILIANPGAVTTPVRIHALSAALPYAFMLSNGAVYVSTGLIARVRTESELAGVIASEIAPVVRRDGDKSTETARSRAMRHLLPNLLLITATAGLAAPAITSGDRKATKTVDEQLRLESDKVALQWITAAGYEPTEVPKGLQHVLDMLTAEDRFGTTELASKDGLSARISSVTEALPPGATEQTTNAPKNDGLTRFSRYYSLRIAEDDMNSSGSPVTFHAEMDRAEGQFGTDGLTSYLRANFARRNFPDVSQLPEVIKEYEACITHKDAPIVAYRELGFLYRRQGDMDSARRNFKEYLRRSPDAADAPIINGYLQGP